jgi:choline dehydrogenase-like flavoprotein
MCCNFNVHGLQYYHKAAVILATMKRQNITIEQEVYEKFIEVASKKGIKLSPWVNSKMKEFVEEEKNMK